MKRTTSLILLLSMLTALISCAADAPKSTETTSADTAEITTVEETTAPPEYIAPDIDYEGATFAVAANNWDGTIRTWLLATYCEIYAEEENGDPINDAVFFRNRKVEEELNVKLELFTIPKMSATSEIKNAILSGDDVFKFASPNGSSLPTFLSSEGMLTDLKAIETFDMSASWWDQNSVDEFDIFGTAYAVTGDFNFYGKGAPICNFFSKKLVEDLGLDSPYDAVNNGQWTIDKMFEYASAAAKDVNGDGQMVALDDNWGIMFEGSSAIQFVRAADQRFSERDADGNIEIVINTEKTVSVVEKVVPFLRDKNTNLYATDHTSNYSDVFIQLFLPKFIDNGAMFYCNQVLVALNLRNMEADFGILPMPKYDEAQENYVSSQNTGWLTFVVVPITNGSLDMTGDVLNSLGYHSQQLVTPAFIDQTVMSKAIRDNESAAVLEMMYDSQIYDIAQYYNWGGVTGVITTLLSSNSTNFASQYASAEKSIQSALEATVELLR